jgi:hypothetical protein
MYFSTAIHNSTSFVLYHQLPPQFNNTPVRLSKKEAKHAGKFIQTFFGAYHLHEIRRSLSALTEIALTTNNTHFDSPKNVTTSSGSTTSSESPSKPHGLRNQRTTKPKTNPKKKSK